MPQLFIPRKISVGFQDRLDTYTGKLAYVIYYDQNDKLRKQVSWDNWRDKEIPPQDFENIPTSGFALNKKVGDYSDSWDNHRMAYIRIYDPRGFEFEITVNNLLMILECCVCNKGKGLEGEFVYSWDGADLVLLPTSFADYKEAARATEIKFNKEFLLPKELVVGGSYCLENDDEKIYLGRHLYCSNPIIPWGRKAYLWEWTEPAETKLRHCFYCPTDGSFSDYSSISKKVRKSIPKEDATKIDMFTVIQKLYEDVRFKAVDVSKDELFIPEKDEAIALLRKILVDPGNRYYRGSGSAFRHIIMESPDGKYYSVALHELDEKTNKTKICESYKSSSWGSACEYWTTNWKTPAFVLEEGLQGEMTIEDLVEKFLPVCANRYYINGSFAGRCVKIRL